MTQKKEHNTDFHTVTIRFYDTALQEKLRNAYFKSDSDSKSNFLTELIEQSLIDIDAFEKRQAEVIASNTEISKQLATVLTRMEVLENTVYAQLTKYKNNQEILLRLAGCLYHVLLALNDGTYLLREELDKGWWDYPPERLTNNAA